MFPAQTKAESFHVDAPLFLHTKMVGTNTTNSVRGHLTGCMSHVTIRSNVCVNSVVNCGLIGEQHNVSVVIVADLISH